MFLRYIAAAIHQVEPVRPTCSTRCPARAINLVETRTAARERAGATEAPARTRARRPARCRQSIVSGRARGALEYVPAGSQIAVASRKSRHLPLARWRTQGMGSRDRRDGTPAGRAGGALLIGARASSSTRARSPSSTSGQRAGRPACISPRCRCRPGRAKPGESEGVRRRDRFVSEYFRHELINRLPDAEVRFLKHTSVLERMSGGLCDAVLETTGSAAMSSHSSARTALSCLATGAASGTDTTTSSGSSCATSSNGPSRRWCPNSTLVRWLGASPTTCRRRRSSSVKQRARRTPSPVWSTAWPRRSYYDGRLETLEEWLGWFNDDELVRYPALAVFGAW